jgi:hypothetical protein
VAKKEQSPKPSGKERAARAYRNLNALGTVALGAAGLLVPPLEALAALDATQAAGGEIVRRHYAKKRKKKSPESKPGR